MESYLPHLSLQYRKENGAQGALVPYLSPNSRNSPDVIFPSRVLLPWKHGVRHVVGTSISAPSLAAALALHFGFQPQPHFVQRLYEDPSLRERYLRRATGEERSTAMHGGFPGFRTVNDPSVVWDPVQGLGEFCLKEKSEEGP